MSLNCIIAMGDRLQGREDRPQEPTSPTGDANSGGALILSSRALPPSTHYDTEIKTSVSPPGSWQEQLLPLVVTLRDCVREAVGMARAAMTFVVLQGAVSQTVAQGPAHVVQRHHAVFSQAVRENRTRYVAHLSAVSRE